MNKTRSIVALVCLAVATALSCGGSVSVTGSESHFLDTCDGAGCGDGLSCICGVCTRTCSASADCSDLAGTSNCVEVADLPYGSTCPASSIQPVCDVACTSDADCASAGGDLRCILGACRRIVPDTCTLPKDPGPCRGVEPRYWHNPATHQCEFFYYGGCEGNANRFETLAECEAACNVLSSSSSGSGGTGGASSGTGGANTGTGGSGGTQALPCDATVLKGGACATEGASCTKTCGPDRVGIKAETCTAGVFVEGVCTFPSGADYSCYQMANPLPECGPSEVTAGTACTYPACTPCGPMYRDSAGVDRTGACVCSSGTWSCSTSTAWPPQSTFPGGPVCDATVMKNGQCSSEGSTCFKTCGPKAVGFKPETCTVGVYVEGTCEFDPAGDYSCFVIPDPLVECETPPAQVQAGTACSVPDCTPCGPDYLDSSGNAKTGYCVCDAATGRWSCASATSWPPQ